MKAGNVIPYCACITVLRASLFRGSSSNRPHPRHLGYLFRSTYAQYSLNRYLWINSVVYNKIFPTISTEMHYGNTAYENASLTKQYREIPPTPYIAVIRQQTHI